MFNANLQTKSGNPTQKQVGCSLDNANKEEAFERFKQALNLSINRIVYCLMQLASSEIQKSNLIFNNLPTTTLTAKQLNTFRTLWSKAVQGLNNNKLPLFERTPPLDNFDRLSHQLYIKFTLSIYIHIKKKLQDLATMNFSTLL